MKFSTRRLAAWCGAVVISAVMPMAHAGPLDFGNQVGNPGFEDSPGVLGWTEINVTRSTAVKRSGDASAEFDYSAGTASLSRSDLFLDSALVYDFSFYLRLEVGCPSGSSALTCFSADPGANLGVSLGGNLVTLEHDSPATEWVRYFAELSNVGTSGGQSPVSLTFSVAQASGFDLYLDEISLSCDRTDCQPQGTGSVPEPGTLLLLGAALAAGSMVRRKKTEH